VLVLVVIIPAAVWTMKKPASGGGSAAGGRSLDNIGFENPVYGQSEGSRPAATTAEPPTMFDDPAYDEADDGGQDESGYMDVVADDV